MEFRTKTPTASMQMIEDKLKRAEEKRFEMNRKEMTTDEKLSKAQERRNTMEAEKKYMYKLETEAKMDIADQLRKEALENIQKIAKKISEKFDKAAKTLEEMEKEKENKLKQQLEKDEEVLAKGKEILQMKVEKAKAEL